MRAVVVEGLGAAWRIEDVPGPVPGTGDVLVQVEAAGICHSDLRVSELAEYGGTFPRIPGHEVVGRVVAVGDGVAAERIGERVGVAWPQRWCGTCDPCTDGRYAFCERGTDTTGATVDGGLAELLVADARSVEPLPEELDPVEAAPLLCAGYTVYSALRDMDVRPGQRVAVVGIGGLGHLALQYARALHAVPIAVTGAVELARELGAEEVIVEREWPGRALAAAGGVDVILATGAHVASDLFSGLRVGGRLAVVGGGEERIDLPARDAVFRDAAVCGCSPGSRRVLRELLALHARAGCRVLTEVHPLEDAPIAARRLADGAVRCRAVVVPGRPASELRCPPRGWRRDD